MEYNSNMWQGYGVLSFEFYFLDTNGEKLYTYELTVGDKDEDNEPDGRVKECIYKDFFDQCSAVNRHGGGNVSLSTATRINSLIFLFLYTKSSLEVNPRFSQKAFPILFFAKTTRAVL